MTVPAVRREARGNNGWAFPDLVVEAWGDAACFTRPELKAERVSYQVMTPSAARGVLEAIFWKPQFRYVVRRIEVLRPVSWLRVRRNEVKSMISPQDVKRLQSDRRHRYDPESDRDQRSTLALRDVRYRIHAQIVVAPEALAGSAKYPLGVGGEVPRAAASPGRARCVLLSAVSGLQGVCRFVREGGPAGVAGAVQRRARGDAALHRVRRGRRELPVVSRVGRGRCARGSAGAVAGRRGDDAVDFPARHRTGGLTCAAAASDRVRGPDRRMSFLPSSTGRSRSTGCWISHRTA